MITRDTEQTLIITYENHGVYHIQCSALVPGPGHVYCTLIVGEDSALLIDNGFGDDDHISFIREITDRPIIAVGTHAHYDHIGGAGQFESIWIGKRDLDMLKQGGTVVPPYDIETRKLFNKTLVIPIEDHYCFDLGDRKVTTIPTPGHTWGSVCFYDNKTKLVIAGDTLNQRVFLQCAKPPVPLIEYKKSLQSLVNYFDFDQFLAGHHPQPFQKSWIDKLTIMIDTFNPSKAVKYNREEFSGNIHLYVTGRGFGDPEYCGFAFDMDELDQLMRGYQATPLE